MLERLTNMVSLASFLSPRGFSHSFKNSLHVPSSKNVISVGLRKRSRRSWTYHQSRLSNALFPDIEYKCTAFSKPTVATRCRGRRPAGQQFRMARRDLQVLSHWRMYNVSSIGMKMTVLQHWSLTEIRSFKCSLYTKQAS